MNGVAIVMTASSFGIAICHRGTGANVRFASVRSSTSFPSAAAAIASTTSGAMEPASIPPNTTRSNSCTDGARLELTMMAAMITGSADRTVMMPSRHRPDN